MPREARADRRPGKIHSSCLLPAVEQQGTPCSEIMGKMNPAESEFPEDGFEVHRHEDIILNNQDPY